MLQITCPRYLEPELAAELEALGLEQVKQGVGSVSAAADQQHAQLALLHSRVANRVLWVLAEGRDGPAIDTSRALYDWAQTIDWGAEVAPGATIAVDFTGTNHAIANSQYGAQVIKDAMVDQLSASRGSRPDVNRQQPDLRVNARLIKGRVTLALDLSGDSLHRRGYRTEQGAAPLKENLAAGLLLRAGWKERAARGEPILDPMCGSGTFLIEALLIAGQRAPGLLRERFGLSGWTRFDAERWQQLRTEAASAAVPISSAALGFDWDASVITRAARNAERAGVAAALTLQQQPINQLQAPALDTTGLVVCNPPYGDRIGEKAALKAVYHQLATAAKQALPGWTLAVLSGDAEMTGELRLRPKKRYKVLNGPLPAEWLLYDLMADDAAKLREDRPGELSEGAAMVANRLRKNLKKLEGFRERAQTECMRVYDADMPEYSAAVDLYGSNVHIQEYAPPKSIDPAAAAKRLRELMSAASAVFEVPLDQIALKQRRPQKGATQYTRHEVRSRRQIVREGAAQLYVDLWQYLDTGLFLDHRPLRLRLAGEAAGKRFLNLFCYTATASVHAILGGARSSVGVDLSHTYLDWGRDNFSLNHISGERHQLVQADCRQWLQECGQKFDLILLDPPSFSNSKRMEGVLDIQRDHTALVTRCMEILAPAGTLYFSNNLQSFKLDEALPERYAVEDISAATIDSDFARNTKIHRAYRIRHIESHSEQAQPYNSVDPWQRARKK